MAEEKKKEEKTKKEEKIFNIPLGDVYKTKPVYRRTSKSAAHVKSFLKRHMKAKDVKIDNKLNLLLWKRGDCKPPRKVQVKATKDEAGVVVAELV